MSASLPEDPTLDEVRAFLAPNLAAQAAFDGWTEKAVLAAAELAGVDSDLARLAFNDGPVDMIDAWFQAIDEQMAAKYSADELAAMKVRQRIKALVEARLDILYADREGLRRADYNHYTKRTLLSGVYGSTISVFLDDESENFAETRAFLDRRIENVMQFEKVKAKVTGRGGDRFSMARFIGRLRYRGA